MLNPITNLLNSYVNDLSETDFLLPESFWQRNITNPMKKNYPTATLFLMQFSYGLFYLTTPIISVAMLVAALIEFVLRILCSVMVVVLLVASILMLPILNLIDTYVFTPILSFMGWRRPEIVDMFPSEESRIVLSISREFFSWLTSAPTSLLETEEDPTESKFTYVARHTAFRLYAGVLSDDLIGKFYQSSTRSHRNPTYTVDLSWAMSGLKSKMREDLQEIIQTISDRPDCTVINLSLRGNCLAYSSESRQAIKAFFEKIPEKVETLDLRDNQLSKLSPEEMHYLEGTLPYVKKLYVSLDEVNQMTTEQYDSLTKIVPNNAKIYVFDRNNKVQNHRAAATLESRAISLNLLEKSKFILPWEIINHIASYLGGDRLMQSWYAPDNLISPIFSLLGSLSLPKPSTYSFGFMSFFNKPNERQLLVNENDIENPVLSHQA